MANRVRLTEEELAFFRVTCDLFPNPESPLRHLQDEDIEPHDAAAVFAELAARELLDDKNSGAADEVRARLVPVCECQARVMLRRGSAGEGAARNFYLARGTAVEYTREDDTHLFGEPLSEAELGQFLAAEFATTTQIRARPLTMSAGDYLVFAVFARDLRTQPESQTDEAPPMSVAEVLAFFDAPETPYVPTPSDASWQKSVDHLSRDGVLVHTGEGYTLHPSLHAVAREIVADHQRTVMRFDFLDEHWLVREVNLYPTDDTVYRLDTRADGAVTIEELSTEALAEELLETVSTLPNILNPDLQPLLKGAALQVQGI